MQSLSSSLLSGINRQVVCRQRDLQRLTQFKIRREDRTINDWR